VAGHQNLFIQYSVIAANMGEKALCVRPLRERRFRESRARLEIIRLGKNRFSIVKED